LKIKRNIYANKHKYKFIKLYYDCIREVREGMKLTAAPAGEQKEYQA
jgi:hypothetical protein